MKKKVLIVDDVSINLYMLDTLLKGYGFEVTSAENGKEALDKARLDLPDLIITDILMPVMDGYTLCRHWKSDDLLKHIPLVFYTATYTEPKDEEFALSLGADRFIIKPQEPDVFMSMLTEVLGKKYTAKQVAAKPLGEEMEFFRRHNEVLFKKLEKKMLDLEIANQKLKVSEECYRLSFRNVSDVICTMDKNLTIISMSPSVEKILGYKPQDLIGLTPSDLGHIFMPDSFEQALSDISLVLKGDSIPATIYRFIAKDGAVKHGEVSVSAIGREGEIIGIVSVARDITDRKQAEDALRESENRFRALFENMSSCVAIYEAVDEGADFIFRDFNRAGEYAERINREDLIGRRVTEVFPGVRDFGIFAVFQRVWRTGNPEGFPVALYKDDRIVGWRDNYVLKLPSGEVVAVYDDITERKMAEEELRESEKKYRDLYDFLPIPVYEMDLEGNITSANRAIYEAFRGTEKDLEKGFNVWQLLSPEDIVKSKKNIQRILKGEQARGTEYTLKRLDGTAFPAIVISSIIHSKGEPVGLRGAIIDISERRKQEEELRRMNVFLDSIVENIPNMIFIKDARELRFIRFNRAGEELLGYSRDDLLGKNDYDFFPTKQADSFTEKDRELLRGKDIVDIQEEPIQTRTKGERILHTKKVPILDAKGKPEYLMGISEDITERKRAEKELEDSRNMLIRSEKLAGIGQLSAGVAHEILNPVNIMGMKLQMLEMTEALSEKTKDAIRTCENQIKRITQITGDLQQFARVSERKITPRNINELIEQVLSLMRPRLKTEDVKVDARYQPDLPLIPVDRDRMGQVILNLINNALDAMKGRPKRILQIITEFTDKNVVRLSFSDTGTGIRPEILSRIFDPFFTTKEEGKGTGLGLSISYGIIQDHNGTIRAENNAGGGASFFIDLPVGENRVS